VLRAAAIAILFDEVGWIRDEPARPSRMINPFKDTNWNPNRAERRKFARSLMIGFPALAVVFTLLALLRTGHAGLGLLWLAIGGAAAGAVFWVAPQIARPFYLAWYFFACCIGIVVSNALLIAFYYLVITPAGLIMRVLGRDPMQRRLDPAAATYWRDAEKGVAPQRYFRQF
jgi:hypothetical protein